MVFKNSLHSLRKLMKFILGTKLEMTQIFDEKGNVAAATILSAGQNIVTQVKNREKDGYEGVQVAYGKKSKNQLYKSQIGHFGDLGAFRFVKEFRTEAGELARGSAIDVSVFVPGDYVTVSSISKGKGFQGVVKRHGFHGGPRSHGQKHSEREPGSIGGGGRAGGRVIKGMRMAGRMGGERVTIKNLKVLAVNKEAGLLVIKGAIPGRRGTLVEVVGN